MRSRHFDSTCEASLFVNNINVSVYDTLIDTVNDNLDLLHRYIRLRKKILKISELHLYDLYMPMIPDATEEIDYETAKKTVIEALSVMGEDYTQTIQKAFDEGWIDVYENEGKRSGAYSWGTYGVHPYILLNHQDNIKSMFTLAHELGHTMHSYYSSGKQPYLYASYPVFLAEVASTVNESLLMQHLLKTTVDPNKRLFLLNHYMESFRTTLYRQVMFAEYEKTTHELAEKGEALTADRLSTLYYDLNKKYYGTEMIVDEAIGMEWARIPHFYYNYYVYQYATGFSSAVAIARNLLDDPGNAVDNYKVFLSSGCSDYPLDALKAAGVDMTTSEPIENALKVFESVLDEMETLIG
jgi:oligoendopeptidase F